LVCPHCQGDARCVGVRTKRIDCLLGRVDVRRHYYHCRVCRRGCFPRDWQMGLNASHLTPAASEVASIAGVQTSFAQSSEVTLKKLCGLHLSESTIERATEAAGERLAKLLRDKKTLGLNAPWQRDARGRSCAYVSLDATGVRQQGEGGARADGRMAYVGMIYNARSRHDERPLKPHSVRYLAGFYDLNGLGSQLRRQAGQVGWDHAEQQIALSDGGAGLEEFFRKNFPLAECILDFWHAAEHLTELALVLYPEDEAKRKQTVDDWCHQLKHEGGAATLRTLQAIDLSAASAMARQAHVEHTRYFENHQHRMDYPRYVANGWQIGSGPVESACKTVVANRLKGSGMRWGSDGSDAVCHLRALYLSEPGQWESFWQYRPNQPLY
jgi:hypothetical protein